MRLLPPIFPSKDLPNLNSADRYTAGVRLDRLQMNTAPLDRPPLSREARERGHNSRVLARITKEELS
jgi:hypothetical protein